MTSKHPSDSISAPTRVLRAQPAATNLTCYGFHVWAQDFLDAAKAYAPVAREASLVPQFLCCQSVELSLKAFLSLKGMTRPQLKRIGHNLTKLLGEACNRGLGDYMTIDTFDVETMETANDWYDTPGGKRLQYFDLLDALGGFREAPIVDGIRSLAERLQNAELRRAVTNA